MFFVVFGLLTNTIADIKVARSGVYILSIPAGARVVGMGSSAIGRCDDPIGIKYNPGAIGFFDNLQLAVMNQGPPYGIGRFIEEAWLKGLGFLIYDETENLIPEPPWLGRLSPGMRYIYGAGVLPIKDYGVLGLNYLYFTTGQVDVFDPKGDYRGSYNMYDYAVGISYGKRLGRLGMGMTVKYIYSLLFPAWMDWIKEIKGSGYSGAIDIGAQYRFKGFNFGVSLLNCGPAIKYGERSIAPLPTRAGWGMSIEPVVILDSILFPNELKINDFDISNIIGIKYNLDRSFAYPDPEKDIWRGSGWEFKIFNYFAYRTGSFEWMGKSTGIGINLGIYSIDVTKFFRELDSYHVQITINPGHSNYYTDSHTKKKIFTIGSLFIAPGGAQFYKGEGLKGALFFIPGLVLGNYYFTNSNEIKRFFALSGIGLLYLGSAIEVFINQ